MKGIVELILGTVLLFCVSNVFARKCYDCLQTPGCVNPSTSGVPTCEVAGGACFKIKNPQTGTYGRGCDTKTNVQMGCQPYTSNGVVLESCGCDADYCNGATTFSNVAMTVTVLLGFVIGIPGVY